MSDSSTIVSQAVAPSSLGGTISLSYELLVWERAVALVWEKSCYGIHPCGSDDHDSVSAILNSTQHVVHRIDLQKGVWLGGCTFCTGHTRDRDRITSILAIASTILQGDEVSVRALDVLENLYKSNHEMVSSLLHHDERCLAVILSLLKAKQFISLDSILNPLSCILFLFVNISFDYEILLEWLQSELVAISFLSRFLEDISESPENVERWKTTADKVQRSLETGHCLKSSGHWEEMEDSDPADDDVIITVRELAGSRVEEKKIRLSRKEQPRVWVPAESFRPDEEEDVFCRLNDMLVRLRFRLQALEKHRLTTLNVNRFVRLIQKFEDIVDE